MKTKLIPIFLILVLTLSACTVASPTSTASPTATLLPTATLRQADLQVTTPPDPEPVAQAFLEAWKTEDYAAMYRQLTRLSRDAISEADFIKRYQDVANEAALSSWETQILASLLKSPTTAEVSYRVTLHSVLVGDIQRDTTMGLVLEDGQWRVQWDEGLILPELKGGNYLSMQYLNAARANIYDRDGHALVAQADAVAIQLNAGEVNLDDMEGLLIFLHQLTGVDIEPLRAKLTNDQWRAGNWGIPVADIASEQLAPSLGKLLSFSGVHTYPFKARYYFDGGIAPHVTGYVAAITAEQADHYKRLGYNPYADRVGQLGLEAWGEQYLGGQRGGKLYLMNPDGSPITVLAERSNTPSQAIYTTIDKHLQETAQIALTGFNGAIVVMEMDTGRVLAMASSPGYNPNLFTPENANQSALAELQGSFWLNRATQGQYPLGSVFKIITTAAALESGIYTKDSKLMCGYFFEEISGVKLNDWTWDHYEEDGVTQPSGELTLPQGLMRSCNPWFYHIGLDFYNRGMTNAIADMARGFGLGSATGIELDEEEGNIPIPSDPLQATNYAIGQGETQVTPLQVADFIAAVGNGGTLYRPTVIEKIVDPTIGPTYVFTATVRGTLPVKPENLAIIQDAMKAVTENPRGTAYRPVGIFLKSYNLSAAGKTGTAQTSPGVDPHAWFGGYTTVHRPDKPDIVVVVILEYQGEGSQWAAPIFSGLVYSYFFPDVVRPPFRWESQPGIWKTPTPEVTETPTPEVTATSSP